MKNQTRIFRIFRGLVLALLIAVILYSVQSPYYLRAPGRATDAATMVHVDPSKSHRASGRFLVTTVFYDRATLLFCVYAMLDPMAELVPIEEEAASASDVQMYESKLVAQLVAFQALGYQLDTVPVGVRVTRVFEEMPADGVLRPGDLVVAAGGDQVRTSQDLVRLVQGAQGKTSLTIRRDSAELELSMTPVEREGRQILGIQIQDEFDLPAFPVAVQIEQGNVSGASAGLIFALEIVNQLTSQDLTGGRVIAGTGTVSLNGEVGPVKGAELKLEAARRGGATVFLCPEGNYAELKSSDLGLEIVPVKTVKDAIEKLNR